MTQTNYKSFLCAGTKALKGLKEAYLKTVAQSTSSDSYGFEELDQHSRILYPFEKQSIYRNAFGRTLNNRRRTLLDLSELDDTSYASAPITTQILFFSSTNALNLANRDSDNYKYFSQLLKVLLFPKEELGLTNFRGQQPLFFVFPGRTTHQYFCKYLQQLYREVINERYPNEDKQVFFVFNDENYTIGQFLQAFTIFNENDSGFEGSLEQLISIVFNYFNNKHPGKALNVDFLIDTSMSSTIQHGKSIFKVCASVGLLPEQEYQNRGLTSPSGTLISHLQNSSKDASGEASKKTEQEAIKTKGESPNKAEAEAEAQTQAQTEAPETLVQGRVEKESPNGISGISNNSINAKDLSKGTTDEKVAREKSEQSEQSKKFEKPLTVNATQATYASFLDQVEAEKANNEAEIEDSEECCFEDFVAKQPSAEKDFSQANSETKDSFSLAKADKISKTKDSAKEKLSSTSEEENTPPIRRRTVISASRKAQLAKRRAQLAKTLQKEEVETTKALANTKLKDNGRNAYQLHEANVLPLIFFALDESFRQIPASNLKELYEQKKFTVDETGEFIHDLSSLLHGDHKERSAFFSQVELRWMRKSSGRLSLRIAKLASYFTIPAWTPNLLSNIRSQRLKEKTKEPRKYNTWIFTESRPCIEALRDKNFTISYRDHFLLPQNAQSKEVIKDLLGNRLFKSQVHFANGVNKDEYLRVLLEIHKVKLPKTTDKDS